MAKNFRRMLAMVLVMCMFVSALPMQALAAESEDVPFTTTDTMTGGDVSITVESSGSVTVEGTNGSGESVEIKGTTNDSGTSLSGKVDSETDNYTYKESVSTSTTTHPDGSTQSVTVKEGSETKEWTGDGVENVGGAKDTEDMEDVKLPSVEVELIPGKESKPVTVTGKVEGQIGDVKEGENDTEYDYTDVTIEADRTVSAEASEIVVTPPIVDTKLECTVDPTKATDKHWDTVVNSKDNPQRNGLEMSNPGTFDFDDAKEYQETPTEDGYDFILSGNGEFTDAAAPVFKYVVYQRYQEGEEIPDGFQIGDIKVNEAGERLIDEEKSKLINGYNYDNGSEAGAHETGMDYQAAQLALTYKDGTYFYAYCADYLVETDLDPAHWYKMENLEDSGHYTEADAAKLRAIAENGYWGTGSEMGSLSQITKNLATYAETNPKVTVKDKNGTAVEFTLVELLGEMKEHEALAVTQAAIWAYSINRKGTAKENEKLPDWADDIIVIGAQSAIPCYTPNKTTEYTPANDQSAIKGLTDEERAKREADALRSDARMKAFFDYLMSLEGKPDTATDVTTVINENNYLEGVSLTVHDRVAGHKDNLDTNNENDIYNVSLNFQLAFTPGENDELYIELTNGNKENPETIQDANNNPIRIKKQLVSKDFDVSEGEEDKYLKPDENGVYTLSGLEISENSEFSFDLRLTGEHELANGVYLYTADGGRFASQTLVGMAKGTQTVDITASMDFKFDVDENNHVVTEHYWRNESDPVITPPSPPEYPVTPMDYVEEDVPAPQVFRLNNDNGLEEIPEEPVPLAAPVITGDNSALWIAVVFLAICGMFIVNITDKKRQHETF